MQDELNKIKQEIFEELKKISESEALKELEIKYLGRKGELNRILRGLAELSGEEKKKIGMLANEIKNEITDKINELRILFGAGVKTEFIDVTLPGGKRPRGHLHPITIIQNELEDLFSSLGFMVLSGPELESTIKPKDRSEE